MIVLLRLGKSILPEDAAWALSILLTVKSPMAVEESVFQTVAQTKASLQFAQYFFALLLLLSNDKTKGKEVHEILAKSSLRVSEL